jgi:ATP-dependent RNA helicase DeaD
MVDELADRLEAAGYMADRLHGDMTQFMRDRVMQKFRKSGLEFLVATDVAARGIDVDDIEVVFNYDLPYDVEDYVHRIGRTGRAGRSGRAISFVAGREMFQIRNIERFMNARIHRGRIPTVGEVEESRRSAFLVRLRSLLQSGNFGQENPLLGRLLEEGFASTDIAAACMMLLQGEDRSGKSDARPSERPRPAVAETRSAPPGLPPSQPTKPAVRETVRETVHHAVNAVARKEVRKAIREDVRGVPRGGVSELPVASRRDAAVAGPKAGPVRKGADFPPRRDKKPRRQPAPAWVAVKRGEHVEPGPAAKTKTSRATPPHQTRLWMNLGEAMEIKPIDIVNAISGETGLPGKVVGTVDIRERHLFVDVAREQADGIVSKLNRANIKGHKVKAKIA